MGKDYLLGKENAFGPTWTTTQSCCMPGARGVTRGGNLCSHWQPGNWWSLPSFSGQVSFPHGEKKWSSEAGTNWPPCWQSQQRCQSEWAWNPTQTLRGFLLRSRLRCFGREVWGRLTLLLSVSRSVKLPLFLNTETQGFELLRCVLIIVLNFVLSEVLSFGGVINASEQGKFLTCS